MERCSRDDGKSANSLLEMKAGAKKSEVFGSFAALRWYAKQLDNRSRFYGPFSLSLSPSHRHSLSRSFRHYVHTYYILHT